MKNLEEYNKIWVRLLTISSMVLFLFSLTQSVDNQGYKSAAQFLVMLIAVKFYYSYFYVEFFKDKENEE